MIDETSSFKRKFVTCKQLPGTKGQSLVELAIGITVLLLLLSGIFDVGRAIFTQFALQDAAEEGIIYGIAYPNECSNIVTRVRNSLENNTTIPSNPAITVRINGANCGSITLEFGQKMVVEVNSTFTMTMPFFAGNTLNLRGTANGTILRPPPGT